jgi:alkanesulfonate monooxygenase SsuD/methylene tetrahydromethanopterin reductase-like flavin-dependent oxidoreductase (luciferase family)
MKRSIVFSTDAMLPLVDIAKRAEAQGFHRLWTTETPTRDGLVRAQMLLAATSTIGVGTGIAYSFTRSPLAVAATAADIAALSGGRLTLGLGFGTRGMRRRWYGLELDHPAPRFAEYVDLVRTAWAATDGLSYHGSFHDAEIPGYHLTHPREILDGIPLYGSGLHTTMLATAASCCDGIALHPLAAELHYLDARLKRVRAARPAGLPLASWRITSIDDDPRAAFQRARESIAFYFSTPSYADVARGRPWEAAAAEIATRFRSGTARWSELADLVPDEMVGDLALAGTPDDVRAQIVVVEAELANRGIDELVLQTVGKGDDPQHSCLNCERMVETLGPAQEP